MSAVETFIVRIWTSAGEPEVSCGLRRTVDCVRTTESAAFQGDEELLGSLPAQLAAGQDPTGRSAR